MAVTRSDLADPAPALAHGREHLAGSSLGSVDAVAVSGATGHGLDELRLALDRLVATLPPPLTEGRVRLWIDRVFTIRGSGTVVTGTLGAGRLAVGDRLELYRRAGGQVRRVTVRGLERLGGDAESVTAVARVAVNLRSISVDDVRRGDVLCTPALWTQASTVDVRLNTPAADLPVELVLHAGTAAVPVRLRPLSGTVSRLRLSRPLPLQSGDRATLRDPARQSIAAGVLVLDADPPALRRRGSAAHRASVLLEASPTPGASAEVTRRGAVRRADLVRLGLLDAATTTAPTPVDGGRDVADWLVSEERWQEWASTLLTCVDEHRAANLLAPRMTLEAARHAAGLPDVRLVQELARELSLEVRDGRVGRPGTRANLSGIEPALATLEARWADEPFVAPEHGELAAAGLGPRQLAAAAAEGRLVRLTDDVVLGPRAPALAMRVLAGLNQPFTVSEARQALRTTRRVAVPLLEHLDDQRWTVRVDSSRRSVGAR